MPDPTARAFNTDGSSYAVMRGDKFLRFGSYRSAYECDTPIQATLYRRRYAAEQRLTGGAWVYGERHDDLRVVKVNFTWEVEDESAQDDR